MLASALPVQTRAASEGAVAEMRLISTRKRFAPAPGVAFDGLAFNGTVPGPPIVVTHGQRVRVRYENRSGEPGSVHWHGMILPNRMDGVAGLTQAPVPNGGSFVYEFLPDPPGTRWYHDHSGRMGSMRGLFGLFIVKDPRDEPADAEFALVFHDVPQPATIDAAMNGTSSAGMVDPIGSSELREMRPNDTMHDEVAYSAHCINGASYPAGAPLQVRVGQRVRLRILNANFTQTRYVRLAGQRLRVTHADGNPLARPLEVEALRVGVGERYDAWFEVRRPGAWLLQGLSSDPLAFEQAVVIHTPGFANATPAGVSQSLEGVDVFSYERAAGSAGPFSAPPVTSEHRFVLGGGSAGSPAWTLNGKVWPDTQKISVARGDEVLVRFRNLTDMDHPMHLHGHTFDVLEVDGTALAHPLAKDVALVHAHGGTLAWRFRATSPAGRWLLHCHNEVHMMAGLMTEVVYRN
jgi:FtsP/CotA-like multicopper oxidase with cupredoxin domain